MSGAAEVPLTERLRSVPSTARFQQDFADGIGTNYWAVGPMCHEAAAEISRLTAELEEARKDAGLSVWYGPMPETNGKSNFTAILHRGDLSTGHTIARSEYPDQVRYHADCVRWLIGELKDRPYILDYDETLHSDYVEPETKSEVAVRQMKCPYCSDGKMHEHCTMVCDACGGSCVTRSQLRAAAASRAKAAP